MDFAVAFVFALLYTVGTMFARIDIRRAYVLECAMQFGRDLLKVLSLEHYAGIVDPLSLTIAESADRLAMPVVCLLSLTCCRYKELKHLDVYSYLEGRPIFIYQPKVGRSRTIPRLSSGTVPYSSTVNVPQEFQVVNYDSVRRAIDRALPRVVRSSLADNCSNTHVFRHLRASWMLALGHDLGDVVKYFGHYGPDTTRVYINDNLVSYFSSLT